MTIALWVLAIYYVVVVGTVFASSIPTLGRTPWILPIFLLMSVLWPVWVPFVWVYEESQK